MKLRIIIAILVLTLPFKIIAQDNIYWSGFSANGSWDWGNGCTSNVGGNWYWSTSGVGDRSRPDCFASFNKIYFDNGSNSTMNLNSLSDFSANQILFQTGTSDRVLNSDSSRSIYFQNNSGNCKIENNATGTTHSFNVPIVINSGNNNMEINPVNGFLNFSSTITNNSNNPINIYGSQQVSFSGNITGNFGLTINNTAVVVFSGTSKTYAGTTTINTGTKLKISSDQTFTNLDLKGGILQVDAGVTLTITGSYSSTGGTIDNKGTIKYSGGSTSFPGNATCNNGTTNTMASFEAASTGTITFNSLIRITASILVSAGKLQLLNNNLHLNNAPFTISSGATFDNGGENQIINDGGTPTIMISGTFITKDKDGFIGSNTVIPNTTTLTTTLNPGSTIEYGLNGDQIVQGSTAPTYRNITFSGSGTKTLLSANAVSGTITVSGTAILDAGNYTFGASGTNITMTESSIYKLGGSGTRPISNGTITLSPLTSFEFTGTSATNIRLSAPTIAYANIIVSGTNVSNSGTSTGILFQNGGKFTVKNGGVFKLNTTAGFSGATNTAINSITNGGPTIILETGSTIEYSGVNQNITPFSPSYSNLTISGTGIKTTTAPKININNDLNISASEITIDEDQTFIVTNKVNNSGGIFTIENNGSLVQINDAALNTGNITYKRITPKIIRTDYTYWSSPVSPQTLYNVSPNTLSGMFYSYDDANQNWMQEDSSNNMIPGKGYIIRGPEGPFFASHTASFVGKPNNGVFTISGVQKDRSYLIGNPYPSALDADTFLNDNAGVLDGTLYFWTHKTPMDLAENIPNPGLGWAYTYSLNDYASYNLTGGVGINDAIQGAGGFSAPNGGAKPTGKIASGQSFFASSKETSISGNQIVIKNSMRVDVGGITGDNSQFFKSRNPNKKESLIEKNRIWLNLTNDKGAFKQTLIGYLTDATNEYDYRFDGITFDGNEIVDFYSINQDKNLVIQGRALPFDENDEVPLGFRTTIDGVFCIKIDQTDGLLDQQAVYLEDRLTNIVFNLKTGTYTFKTESGTFNDRFVLRYTNKLLSNKDFENSAKTVFIASKNKEIKINSNNETINGVTIYDLLGRQLYHKDNIRSNELTIPNLGKTHQSLLVKVSLENGQIITKKIIN